MEFLVTPEFWIGLGTIIWVNIILSGDNAVVIALAARSLPPRQQKQAIFWGAGAAVVLRIVLTIVAVKLLEFPYLKLVGGAALLWIAVQLLMPDEGGGDDVGASSNLWSAVKTILIADLVMSTDNVIAVAAAAKGSILLLVLGLVISIPLVVFGAAMLMKLMERFPIIITLGAAILGWTAGEMGVTDPAVAEWVNTNASWLHWGAPAIGAVLVVAVGSWLAKRKPTVAEKHA
jgi:YjbE family integral membrane protein